MEYTPLIAVPLHSRRIQVIAGTASCRVLRATDLTNGNKTLVIEIPDYTELQPNWQLPPHIDGLTIANRIGFVKDGRVPGPNVKDLRPKPNPMFRVVDPRTGKQLTYVVESQALLVAATLAEEIRKELARAYPNAAVPFCPPHIPVTEVYE